jgi:hypothetical protein
MKTIKNDGRSETSAFTAISEPRKEMIWNDAGRHRVATYLDKIEGRNKEPDYYSILSNEPRYRGAEYWKEQIVARRKDFEEWQQAQKSAEEQRTRPPQLVDPTCHVQVECGYDGQARI